MVAALHVQAPVVSKTCSVLRNRSSSGALDERMTTAGARLNNQADLRHLLERQFCGEKIYSIALTLVIGPEPFCVVGLLSR